MQSDSVVSVDAMREVLEHCSEAWCPMRDGGELAGALEAQRAQTQAVPEDLASLTQYIPTQSGPHYPTDGGVAQPLPADMRAFVESLPVPPMPPSEDNSAAAGCSGRPSLRERENHTRAFAVQAIKQWEARKK
jgi:hypothetical protein